MADQLKANQIVLVSDASQVISILSGNFVSCPWHLWHLYVECKARLSVRWYAQLNAISRVVNWKAHNLTENCLYDVNMGMVEVFLFLLIFCCLPKNEINVFLLIKRNV